MPSVTGQAAADSSSDNSDEDVPRAEQERDVDRDSSDRDSQDAPGAAAPPEPAAPPPADREQVEILLRQKERQLYELRREVATLKAAASRVPAASAPVPAVPTAPGGLRCVLCQCSIGDCAPELLTAHAAALAVSKMKVTFASKG
jgi:hypothetical protein